MSTFINDLPVELLIGIMRHLDQESLKEASLTCEKWKSVIESHVPWSIEVNTTVTSHHVKALKETNRKICEMKLCNQYQIDLTRSWECLTNYLLFVELLKCFPNLEDFCFQPQILLYVPEDCDLPDLKKLKSLKMWRCQENILKCFRTSGLKSLSIKSDRSHSTNTEHHVVDFLLRQQNLTKLHLESFGDLFFQQLCHKTPNGYKRWKLTKLAIRNFDCTSNKPGVLNFIKMYSQTLQTLELNGHFPPEIYELIFKELKNLKFLILGIHYNTAFRENWNRNMSIEKLVLDCSYGAPRTLNFLCESVPNVTNLILLNSLYPANLDIISSTLRNVTTLSVHIFDNKFNKIKFPNLTSLSIGLLIDDKVDWHAFTIANSKITEITIINKDSGSLKLEHVKAITRNLKLQTFKIGSKLSADDSFLSVISENFPEFKVIDTQRYCENECLSATYSYDAREM